MLYWLIAFRYSIFSSSILSSSLCVCDANAVAPVMNQFYVWFLLLFLFLFFSFLSPVFSLWMVNAYVGGLLNFLLLFKGSFYGQTVIFAIFQCRFVRHKMLVLSEYSVFDCLLYKRFDVIFFFFSLLLPIAVYKNNGQFSFLIYFFQEYKFYINWIY